MDGVLADFEGWAATQFEDWRKEIESPQWGAFGEFHDLFALLPPMYYARELYEACVATVKNKNQVQILTALPNRTDMKIPDAAKHKIEWAKKHISPDIRVHFGPNAQHKMLHVKHENDILIDDMSRNVSQWIQAGGTGIWHRDIDSTLTALQMYSHIY